MEPIQSKRPEVRAPQKRVVPETALPKRGATEPAVPEDEVLVLTPEMRVDQPQKDSKSQTKSVDSKPVESQKPPPPNTFQNGPEVVLEEPSIATDSVGEVPKTLAQIAADVSKKPEPAVKPLKAPPAPPLSQGRKAGIIRRLGHAFLSLLTSDNLGPFRRDLQEINKLESMAKKLKTPEQFQAKTAEFKARLAGGESLADVRNEAYAVAREACFQSVGMRPYDCQVLGALAMDDGHIAEMRTGEGKTLTAVLPMYLNALAGKGAHLVTVNDTLAARDAQKMGPAYQLLGLTVGTVLEDMKKDEKRAGYAADVTYTTDRALGFDYLRDTSATNPVQKLQREPFFALVDEVDEVFIDEARSPLIISGRGESHQESYQVFNDIVASLEPGADYYFDKKKHTISPSETGYSRVENKLQQRQLRQELETGPTPERRTEIERELSDREKLSSLITEEQRELKENSAVKESKPGWWARRRGAEWDEATLEEAQKEYSEAKQARVDLEKKLPALNLFDDENAHRSRFLYSALKAHALFKVDKDYTITAGKVEIVDQNKGRTSEGRRYNDGVHQALEAKHGLPIQEDSRTTATITYPNLFKKYPRLSGMSGTAKSSEYEFLKLYELDVVQVPTNKPVIREDKPDIVFRTLDEKFEAIANDAFKDFSEGRPVLVGTLSVESNEWISKLLLEKGVPRESLQVLNAETVRGDKEGENEMLSQAGRSGVITVATNLAGRGADIKPDFINFQKLAQSTVAALNDGKSVVVSVNKEEEAEWLQSWLDGIPATVVPGSEQQGPTEAPVQIRYTKGVDNVVAPEANDSLVTLDSADFPTHGLKVYGTERSSSRRIDDQLIGRSGRQGAPGTSQFYLSLEDDLFRVIGSNHLDSVVGLFLKPGQGIESDVLDSVIGKIQGEVEMEHYKARESSNKQDEVLNIHRDTFQTLRNEILAGGKGMVTRFDAMTGNAMLDSINSHLPDKPRTFTYMEYREAVGQAQQDLGVPIELAFLQFENEEVGKTKMKREDFEYEVQDLANRNVAKVMRTLGKLPGPADATLRPMILDSVDSVWADHLEEMDLLHRGVQWRQIAQQDPDTQFKLEAYSLFGESVSHMEKEVVKGPYKQMLGVSELFASIAAEKTSPNP